MHPDTKTDAFRKLKRNSIFLYIAEFIPRFGSLLIVPIWSARVVPAEYARWVLSLSSVELLISLSTLGLIDYMVKILFRYHNERAYNYFGLALKVVMASTGLVALGIALASPFLSRWVVDSQANSSLFAFLALYMLFAQFNSMSNTYALYTIQNGLSLALGLSRWAVNTSLILFCLLKWQQGFYSWVWASLGAEMMIFPISLYILRHIQWGYFNRRMLSFALRFSLPSMTNMFLGWGQSRFGRYVLSFTGLGTGVGLLGVAQSFSLNYPAMVRPVKLVAQRMIGHRLEQDAESPHFLEFFHFFTFVCLSLAFLAAMFFQDIMKMFIASSYWDARAALPALILAGFMEEMFTMYHALMFRYFKVWFDSWRTLIAFPIVVVASLLLIPRYGFFGAALAQAIGSLSMWLFAQIYASRVSPRAFLFNEKMLATLIVFCVSEAAYFLHWPLGWRIVISLSMLLPYLYFTWARRHHLFPRLTNHLIRITHESGNARLASLLA